MEKYMDTYRIINSKLGEKEFFLTGVGLETVLIYEKNFELPEFAAFVLYDTENGREALKECLETLLEIAQNEPNCKGFMLETGTWRASKSWADKIGISKEKLTELTKIAVKDSLALKKEWSAKKKDFVILVNGLIGSKGDGYQASDKMTAQEAYEYHLEPIKIIAEAGADSIIVATLTYTEEAIGITKACQELKIPVALGFTVETDGKLPSGSSLEDAIYAVDKETKDGPIYYMINCAHFDHFSFLFKKPKAKWMSRVKAIRANPSRLSHEELDNSPVLVPGDPVEYGKLTAEMKQLFPDLRILGGCCGTNHEHAIGICQAMAEL